MYMDFNDWINRKYLDWRGDSRKSVTEFAAFLKISQPTVSAWMNRTRDKPESKKIVDRLIKIYGEEVYEILGIQLPEGVNIPGYPNMSAMLSEAFELMRARGVPDDSPDAIRIIREVAARYDIREDHPHE